MPPHTPGDRLVDRELVVSASQGLDEGMPGDHDAGAAFLFEPSHRPQPCLQAAVTGLDSVVGIPLGAVPGRLEQVVQHRQVGQGSVGDDLDRGDLGRPDGPFEEAAGSGCVPTWDMNTSMTWPNWSIVR
jgi:hypothetical protein